ncbi:conserved oligomeric Golgi complex subunit 3 [Diorhabda sublineata]|uniref:conserved oligomeric Golgi complex subunit 3 n=1 Tax=Diorhabda sublineata TaxID=1163346 RepID=UPI0024E134C3|nr:conserved oligomeric Golgi complex subunit 3 [Diorhabda sublineata]
MPSVGSTDNSENLKERVIQDNIVKWQSLDKSLAPLSAEQLDVIYELGDLISNTVKEKNDTDVDKTSETLDTIYTLQDFVKWTIAVEHDIKHENLKMYQDYYQLLTQYKSNCEILFDMSDKALCSLNSLKENYNNVTEKTNYLHDLSEQLMANQKILKEKKQQINDRIKYFIDFTKCQDGVERIKNKMNNDDCIYILDKIDESIDYLNQHLHYKESRIYKMKYESLLNTILNKIYDYVNTILVETTKQVVDPNVNFQSAQVPHINSMVDSAFSLYYGKFQSVSVKVRSILNNLEERETRNDQYKNVLIDCKKSYFTQRLPILTVAVGKALTDLKEKYYKDHSTLFRSCCLFILKVCQDEVMCFNYFFSKGTEHLNDYLGALCQCLYDTLRPNLITIIHIEVLCELCGILRNEFLSDKVVDSIQLSKYVEIIKQLWQDVEERLVFRTNVFFQYDLLNYKPSPGDLAYPEKLEQIESIVLELKERSDSRSSVVSLESQEVANINSQMSNFRSYTGNASADLHGMWYPTVKRTLVCLSRLYFCLDRSTFQGLAQEAIVICIETVKTAANLISTKKTKIDGFLFQIKHLLIIREQIAPFQVDFTVKETTLDFTTVQKAAMDLINHRNKIFTFGSNNALLEFLLEGTPKVKEHLIDSRKEIDKQLKQSCEAFITLVTQLLVGNILDWIAKSEKTLQQEKVAPEKFLQEDFAKAETLSSVVKEIQKNMKIKIPQIQRSMQIYLSNRETEFILFRPIKNNIVNAFMQLDQILLRIGYSNEDQLLIGCPSPEQINILICSVSLSGAQENSTTTNI